MGLATLPSPAEGMLCVVMVNTATSSINILKHILRSILHHVVGIHYPSSSNSNGNGNGNDDDDNDPCTPPPPPSFRQRNPAVRFYTVCREKCCSVCLRKFKPAVSEVNQLECGHVYHKECLERWMEYWNTTCPLCRTPIIIENTLLNHHNEEDGDTIMYYY